VKVFAAHGRTGAAFYRLLLPLGELGRQRGFSVTLKPGYEPISSTDFAGAGVIVGQRVGNPVQWAQAGSSAALVYEIDDDVFSILPENKLAYADYQRAEVREGTEACIARADLVTVTTEPLAEVMRRYNANVAVLPNHVPDWVFDLPQPSHQRLSIGWAGGASHTRNIDSVATPVRRFLKRSGWVLRLVGTDYRDQLGGAEFTPWTDIVQQPEAYYSALNFDIGIAPLRDNQFNRCKSPLRLLEYAARGIPVVASDVAPYREFIEDGVTGFLVRHEHEWLKRLSELAADEDLRTKVGRAAQEKARAWAMSEGWNLWASAYASVT
jgi:glycosyltransferase involved in cell wall biosynthesis